MSRINIYFSFDTTGSMYPCLSEVRRKVKKTVGKLFKEMPDLKIGIIAHGDYCDKGRPYTITHLPMSGNVGTIQSFIQDVSPTNGGDAPECYELVLHEAKSYEWDSDAEIKILVMIGDAVPHLAKEAQNYLHLDWEKEAQSLVDTGVRIYSVRCLNYNSSWWSKLASIGQGAYLELHQFSHVLELIQGICYKQVSDERLSQFAASLKKEGKLNRSIAQMLNSLSKKKIVTFDKKDPDLEAVDPTRFQVLHVDNNCAIKEFVIHSGATFRKGRGFYEFTKTETIQERKEIVLVDKKTGDMFSGDKAREMIGLPVGVRGRIMPTKFNEYDVFVQSTSSNRKLIGGTRFLYET